MARVLLCFKKRNLNRFFHSRPTDCRDDIRPLTGLELTRYKVNRQRRLMIKGTAAGAALGTAVAAGLITPSRLLAATGLQPAFAAKSVDDVLAKLFPGQTVEANDAIKIKAPDIAENGAVVPVSVSSQMNGIDSISLIVSNNATPLVASFDLPGEAEAFVSTRIKMGKTSDVVAIAKAGDKLYRASKEVKVTIGGCGG